MDYENELRFVIIEWVMSQALDDLNFDEGLLRDILDYKLEIEEACPASDKELEEMSKWMENNQGEFDYFIEGDNDLDYDLAWELYEDAIEKV